MIIQHDIVFNIDGEDAMTVIRRYENGEYGKGSTIKSIITRHPNVVKCLIISKKSWGLWVKEWSLGIAEGTFTKFEILKQYDGIHIPDSLMEEFNNAIWKARINYNSAH